MLKTKKQKLTVIIFLILVCSFLIYLYTKPEEKEIISPALKETQVAQKGFLEINSTKYEEEILGEISIYDFMKKMRDEEKISFTEKTYVGMGKFIESIDGIKNGEKNWIYYVNDTKANIGISNYKIKPGDVVSWKYEDSY